MPRRKKRRSYGSGSYWQLPSGRYQARVFVGGAKRECTLDTESQIKDWLEMQGAERVARITGTLQTRGFRPDVTLADLAEDFLADRKRAGRTAQTLRGYTSDVAVVTASWGTLRIADVDGPSLEAAREEMAKRNWAPSTVRNRLNVLCGIARFAMRRGYVPARELPIERPRVTIASRPDVYADDAIEALLKAARALDRRAGGRPLQETRVLLGLDAGLRLGEIVRARHEDLDAKHLALRVPVRGPGDEPKSHQARTLPITKRLADRIRACPGEPKDRIVSEPTWESTTPLFEWMMQVWAAAGVEHGAQPVHRLRHTWATRFLEAGGTVPELMAYGGWTSLAAMRRYVHEPETLRRGPVEEMERRGKVRKTRRTAYELPTTHPARSKKA